MNFFIYLKYVWCDLLFWCGANTLAVCQGIGLTVNISRVGFQWALPGVVVGVVVPLSVSVGDALELLVTDIVVSISVGVKLGSVDALLTGDSVEGSVHGKGGSRRSESDEFHFNIY